jgi:hypothetical protein
VYHHSPKSAALIVKKAGFDIQKAKCYSVMGVFASTLNNVRHEQGKTSIPALFFAPFAPLYRLFGIITSMGDNITIWAKRV